MKSITFWLGSNVGHVCVFSKQILALVVFSWDSRFIQPPSPGPTLHYCSNQIKAAEETKKVSPPSNLKFHKICEVWRFLGGDYMIPAFRDEISTRPAEKDFTLWLHMEITFRPGKAGQFSTWYLIRFACIFFEFFFVSMSFYETEDS